MGRPKRSRPLSVRRKHPPFAPFPRDADTDTLLRAQETAVPFSARQSIPYVQKGTLYSYAPKANGWSKIARIIQPGIYEAVYGRPTSVKSNASRDTVGPKPAV